MKTIKFSDLPALGADLDGAGDALGRGAVLLGRDAGERAAVEVRAEGEECMTSFQLVLVLSINLFCVAICYRLERIEQAIREANHAR